MKLGRYMPKSSFVAMISLLTLGLVSGIVICATELTIGRPGTGQGMDLIGWGISALFVFVYLFIKIAFEIRFENGPELSQIEVEILVDEVTKGSRQDRAKAARQLASMARKGNETARTWLTSAYPAAEKLAAVTLRRRVHKISGTEVLRIRNNLRSRRVVGALKHVGMAKWLWFLLCSVSGGGLILALQFVEPLVPEPLDPLVSIACLLPYSWLSDLTPWRDPVETDVSALTDAELFASWIESIGTIRDEIENELRRRQTYAAHWILAKIGLEPG